MLRAIAVLLVIPLLDALLLLVVADQFLGWQLTVLLVVLTALLGSLLVRAEGRHTLSRIQEKLMTGDVPTDELIDGAFLVAAGAFFLTPGLVTDALGLLLAVPLTRAPIRAAAKRWVIVPYFDAKSDGMVSGNVYIGGFPTGDGGVGGVAGGPGGPSQDDPRSTGDESESDFDSDDATDIDFDETDDQ